MSFDDLTQKRDIKRDRWDRPLIPQADGKTIGYQRVTTLAKALDDTYNINQRNKRFIVKGMALKPELISTAASHTVEDRKEMEEVAEQAMEAAGANEARRLGTALHRFTERRDRGEQFEIPAPYDADVYAYDCALALHGINMRIDDDYIEPLVVCHSLKVAGSPDRLAVDVPGYGPCITDLKTGKLGSYSWPGFCMQLSIYANADAIYLGAGQWRDMPEVNREWGAIIHLPVGKGECTIWMINLAAGWEAVNLAQQVKAYRAAKGLAKPYERSSTSTSPALKDDGKSSETSQPMTIGASAVTTNEPSPSASSSVGTGLTASTNSAATPSPSSKRDELTQRVQAIIRDYPTAPLVWPAGVATLKSDHQHDDSELELIDAAVSHAEKVAGIPFGAVYVAPLAGALTVAGADLLPADSFEGPNINDAAYQLIVSDLTNLELHHKQAIQTLQAEAEQQGIGFGLKQQRSVRRQVILTALIELVRATNGDLETMRGAIREVDKATDKSVGSFTIDEAELLLQAALNLSELRAVLTA